MPTRREQSVSNQVRDSEGELQFKLFQKAVPSKIAIESTRFPPFRTRYHGDKPIPKSMLDLGEGECGGGHWGA